MPISSISTSFIQILAPVLENAASIKNAGKQHFVGVSPYFTCIWCHTESFSALSNKNSKNGRSESTGQKLTCSTLRITCIVFFGNHYLPINKHHLPHYSKSYLLSLTTISILYQLFYCIFTTIISIFKYCYHIVTILISII